MTICIECGENYNSKRAQLGYQTCLDCGGADANELIRSRARSVLRAMTPNHYDGDVRESLDKIEE